MNLFSVKYTHMGLSPGIKPGTKPIEKAMEINVRGLRGFSRILREEKAREVQVGDEAGD